MKAIQDAASRLPFLVFLYINGENIKRWMYPNIDMPKGSGINMAYILNAIRRGQIKNPIPRRTTKIIPSTNSLSWATLLALSIYPPLIRLSTELDCQFFQND